MVPEPRHRRHHARPALRVGDARDHGDAALAARSPHPSLRRRRPAPQRLAARGRAARGAHRSPRSSTPSRTCGVIDAVVPLASRYRPLWLGFGALAFDLLVALIVTSVLRARLGLRAWRAVHWAAYACWPVAVLHGLGTGTDARSAWLQAADRRVRGRRRRRARGAPAARLAGAGRAAPRRSRARRRLGRGRRRVRAAGPVEAGLGAPRRHAAHAAGGGAVAGGHAHRQRSADGRAPLRRRARRHLQADRLCGRRARAGRHRGPDPRRRRAAAPRPAALWPGPSRRRPADGLQQRQARPAAVGRTSTAAGWSGCAATSSSLVSRRPVRARLQLRLALRIHAGGAVVGTADAQEVA